MWIRLLPLVGVVSSISQRNYRKLSRWVLVRSGVRIVGQPLWISPRAFFDISFRGSIEIGDRSVVSHFVRILTHDFSLDRVAERLSGEVNEQEEFYRVGAVKIGRQVFVGMGATIMPGVSIGDGAVIATNALVSRDVPADSVVAGVPARVVSTTDAYFAKRKPDYSIRRRRP